MALAVWGLDIVGPLRKAPGGYTHLLVAIDKFSKWVEVRPITNLRAELRTMCGSRTGGWSLPCVMSD
jgi:hypothetical protein